MIEFHDRVAVAEPRRTADGYLVADAKVARTGIQEYLGSEVGRPEMRTVRVYRPPDEVFAADAMKTYAYRPMTNDHPRQPVTADNWRQVSIGQTGGEVVRDGECVRVPMVLMDGAAIKAFEEGKRELSMGYTATLVFDSGTTPEGEAYDAIQTNLRMNHLALVDRARGGAALRIGDDNPARNPTMSDIKTRTVMVDGLSVETTDAGAQAISKLQQQVKDGQTALANAESTHAKAIEAKDAEIAKLEAARDDLKGKVLTDAQIDARVQARADLIDRARHIADGDYSGKSDAEIRRAAVVAKLGDEAVKDRSDAYIEARFDILADEAGKPDPVRSAIKDRKPTKTVDNGQAAYEARLRDAWKGTSNKENV